MDFEGQDFPQCSWNVVHGTSTTGERILFQHFRSYCWSSWFVQRGTGKSLLFVRRQVFGLSSSTRLNIMKQLFVRLLFFDEAQHHEAARP